MPPPGVHHVKLVSNDGFVRSCDLSALVYSYLYFQVLFSCIPDEELYPTSLNSNKIPDRRKSEPICEPGNHVCGRFDELASEYIHFPQFSKEDTRLIHKFAEHMLYFGTYFSQRLKEMFNGWEFEKLLEIGTYFGNELFLLKSIKLNTKLFANRQEFFWTDNELERGYMLTNLIVKYDIDCFVNPVVYNSLWNQYTPCLSRYFHKVRHTLNVQNLEYPYFKIFLASKLEHFRMNKCINTESNGFSLLMNFFHMTCWYVTGKKGRINTDQFTSLLSLFSWKYFSIANLHYILSNYDLPADTCADIYCALDQQCLCVCCQRIKCCPSCFNSLDNCNLSREASLYYECNHKFPSRFSTYCTVQVFGIMDCTCYEHDVNCEYGSHLFDNTEWNGTIYPVYGITNFQLQGVESEEFAAVQNRVYKHANIYHSLQAIGLFIYRIKQFFESYPPEYTNTTFCSVIESWLTTRSLVIDFPSIAESRVRIFYEKYPWIPKPHDIKNAVEYFPEN